MVRAFTAGIVVLLTGVAVSRTASADDDSRGATGDLAFWTRMVELGQEQVQELSGHYVPLPTPAASASAPPSGVSPVGTTPSGSTSQASPDRRAGTPTVGGWYAGATGKGVTDGDFAAWLGQPVTIAGTWNDTSDDIQRTQPSLTGEFAEWRGAIDIAVAGTVLGSGESYAEAAGGSYDARWTQAATVIAASRRDATGPTFVRPWHEMNGDWYPEWVVDADTVQDYKAAFHRFAAILKRAMPGVYITWSPNDGNHQELPVSQMYPGDDVVDVIAPDSYDWTGSPDVDVAGVEDYLNRSGPNGEPAGLETWRRFAAQHGKPLGLPEWGLCAKEGCGGDHPAYLEAMNAWMREHANTATWELGAPIPAAAAGALIYSIYFDTVHAGDTGFLIRGGQHPESEALFPRLRWGTAAAGQPSSSPGG
ncbi:MAG: glycosyl hydrolase [Kineosporiaceae bacterium]